MITDYLLENIGNVEGRIAKNPENVPREILVLIARNEVRSKDGEYALTLFKELNAYKEVHGTKVDVRAMSKEEDGTEYVPGLKCTLTVDKTTDLPKLKAFLKLYHLYYKCVYKNNYEVNE